MRLSQLVLEEVTSLVNLSYIVTFRLCADLVLMIVILGCKVRHLYLPRYTFVLNMNIRFRLTSDTLLLEWLFVEHSDWLRNVVASIQEVNSLAVFKNHFCMVWMLFM